MENIKYFLKIVTKSNLYRYKGEKERMLEIEDRS